MISKVTAPTPFQTILLKLSVFNLLATVSTEIVFNKTETATLVPFSLTTILTTTQKMITILPETGATEGNSSLNKRTLLVNGSESGKNCCGNILNGGGLGGVKLKKLSQKKLDDEIRFGGKQRVEYSTYKPFKRLAENFTVPTLQKIVRGKSRRKSHRKKHRKHNLVNSGLIGGNTKEFSLSDDENNESESRSYNNYDPPVYPVYNYAPPSPTTSGSGEDTATSSFANFGSNFGSNFATGGMWSGYPDPDTAQTPTFPPLTTTYAPKVLPQPMHSSAIPMHGDYTFGDWKPPMTQMTPLTASAGPPRFRKPMGFDEPPIYVDYLDDTRVISLDGLGRYWHAHGHPPIFVRTGFHRFQDEDSIEYQPYRDGDTGHGHGVDWHKVAIAILMKIGLLKLKLFVMLKLALLFLIKLKLLLMALFLKVLIILKGIKLLKLMFVPLIIAALVPLIGMILIPLLGFLPMLISFLLNNIRVPVFTPGDDDDNPDGPDMRTESDLELAAEVPESSRAPVNGASGPITPATLQQFKLILLSEQCLKRLVCEMAVHRKPSFKSFLISRVLDVVSAVVPSRKIRAYLKVYQSALYVQKNQTESWCPEKYECSHFKKRKISSR